MVGHLVRAIQEQPITICLHQGITLSLFLFAAILDEIIQSFWEDQHWRMLFAMTLFCWIRVHRVKR